MDSRVFSTIRSKVPCSTSDLWSPNELPAGPTKVLDLNAERHWIVQLRCPHLSRKNYGLLRQNQYSHEQAAILQERFDRFFRGRDSIRRNGRIAVVIRSLVNIAV